MSLNPNSDLEVKLLLEAIYEKYNYDFRNYALSSVKRRLGSALSHFSLGTLSRLQEKVLHDPKFFNALLQFMTVPTSEMFRDPAFFLALKKDIFPVLETYPSIKLWIAGCSTGEEVYSFAILLKESGLYERTTIYATDINPVSIGKAEQGIFAADRLKEFSRNYQEAGGVGSLSDYFSSGYNSVLMDKGLRKNVVFADHSLATDSVFSEMQLISCRNVLIYFNRELQNRAFGLFYESLSRGGFLGLGAKESIKFSDYANYFTETHRSEKIYQKKF